MKYLPHFAVLLSALTAGIGGVSAATLGGLGAPGIVAIDAAATLSAPTIVGCDNFTGTTGASMAGRTVTVAANCSSRQWTTHVGTWTIQANTAASSTTASAVATLDTALTNGSVQATLSNLNTSGRSGGLVLSHNGSSTYLAAVMIDGTPDRIELRIVVSGTSTLLTTWNPTFATTNTLRMSRAASTVTVTLNGVALAPFALSAGNVTSLGGGRAGLFGGNASVRFDNLAVTNP